MQRMAHAVPFPAALIGRQLDVSSLISVGLSVASSVLPEVTSALSVQVSVVPDSTGGSATSIITPSTTSASTTASPATTSQVAASTSSGTSATSSGTSLSSSVFASAASSTASSTAGGHHTNKTGIIVGVVLGVVVLALLALLLCICLRRRRRNSLIFGRRRPTTPSIDSEAGVEPMTPVAVGRRNHEVTQVPRSHDGITPVPVPPSYQASTMRHDPFGDPNRTDRKEGSLRNRSGPLGPLKEHPEPDRAETPSRWPPLTGAYPLDGSESPSGGSGHLDDSPITESPRPTIARKPVGGKSHRDSPTLGATSAPTQDSFMKTAPISNNPAHNGWARYYEKPKGTWLDDTY